MFPFQRSCELSFKISDEGDQVELTNLEEDQIMLDNNASVVVLNNTNTNTNPNPNPGRGRGRGRVQGRGRGRGRILSSSLAGTSDNTNTNNDEDERKFLHREYERQRRQEMANLYNSLRLTLPAESIQGKRSVSDHVGEAVSYIQHLKKNVNELEEKRDELKHSVESSSSTSELGGSSNSSGLIGIAVLIRESVVGFEIEISVGYEDEGWFSLASALQVVFDEGLEVVSCTSTKFNERIIHHLQCQVANTTCIDVNRLQQRLNELVC